MQTLNYHPDKGGDVSFAQLLNEALSTLGDTAKRREYDQLRQQHYASLSEVSDDLSISENPQAASDTEKKRESGQDKGEPHVADSHQALSGRAQCPFCHAIASRAGAGKCQTAYTQHATSSICQRCTGPATPVSLLETSKGEELRRMYRRLHTETIRLWSQWPLGEEDCAVLTDFSIVGCALDCANAYPANQILLLKTSLFDAIGRVRFCQPSQHALSSVGIEFIMLNASCAKGQLLSASA